MKNNLITLACFLCTLSLNAQEYTPITTEEIVEIDTFFNQYIIEDKYRWLEDVDSEETIEWVKEQSKMSNKYLAKSSIKTNSFKSIDKYSYVKFDFPRKKGDYYFRLSYPNKFSVPALYYHKSLNSRPMVLIDPNLMSSKDKIVIKDYSVSKDSKLLAYQFNRNGSDWTEVKIVSLKTGTPKPDHLKGIKFSNIAWLGDGFFYSTYNQQNKFSETIEQKVFYHKVGTDQKEDQLIFERKNKPLVSFRFQTTSNERFFLLKEIDEQKREINIYYIDYKSAHPSLKSFLKPLVIKSKKNVNILNSHKGKLIAKTFSNASNGMIVEIDPENPYKWKAIVQEYSEAVLMNVYSFADRIVAIYQANQHSIISIFDYSGNILHSLPLPVARSIGKLIGDYWDEEVHFYYTSYTIPPIVHKLNIKTFKNTPGGATLVNFDSDKIVYKEIEYLSKDGTAVSMVLVYEKGIKLNGSNPTLLKAYGGFGLITPLSFDPGIVHFVKKGGIFAFANIRGGGNKGRVWAKAGSGKNKQNSFDDFISAAEFLIKKGYTNKDKLAITGGSNGGLVVAVAAMQRPDLFKAVVPIVAPLDMLRFEYFTVGHMHTDEYGTISDSTSFTRLNSYSPYHNIKENFNYPTMLIITSENDDRVPPFHSHKFAAKLQNRSAQKNPILLKVEKNAGHQGAATSVSIKRSKADIYGFIMNEIMKD